MTWTNILQFLHKLIRVNEVLPSSVQAFSKQIPEANDHVKGLSGKARFDLLQAPLSELINSFHSLANDDTNEPTEPTDPAELDVPTSIVHNVDLYATETAYKKLLKQPGNLANHLKTPLRVQEKPLKSVKNRKSKSILEVYLGM